MATATLTTGAPARLPNTPATVALAARRGTTIIPSPAPREPNVAAMVIAGIRCFEIRTAASGVSAHWHQRDGAWFPLAVDASLDEAAAAVGRFLSLVDHLPPGWSQEADDTEVAAAVAVLAGPASLPLAA